LSAHDDAPPLSLSLPRPTGTLKALFSFLPRLTGTLKALFSFLPRLTQRGEGRGEGSGRPPVTSLIAALVLLFLPALFGCQSHSLNAVALVPPGHAMTNEFWKSVHAGAIRAGQEMRVQILWKGPLREGDREQQIQIVKGFVNMQVLGIALAPLDSHALVPAAQYAAHLHVPLVIFDSKLDSNDKLSYVAPDDFHGGQLAGEHLGALLTSSGGSAAPNANDTIRVAILRYQEGSDNTTQREQGFLDAIAHFPTIKVVSSNQYGGATAETAVKASETLLAAVAGSAGTAGAPLQGIFCPNESTTLGMLRALEDRHLAGKVHLIGFDTSAKIVEALRQGHMDATVVQDPMRLGYLAVKAVIDHLRGATIAKRIDTGATLVRRQDMDQPKMKALLVPDYRRWLKE
jgi:ribose transport system substrate-binding protein